jgi:hypothetical protein
MGDELKKMNCGNCYYWDGFPRGTDLGNVLSGFCRRHAPSPSYTRSITYEDLEKGWHLHEPRVVYWPLTFADRWCGDWKKKEV